MKAQGKLDAYKHILNASKLPNKTSNPAHSKVVDTKKSQPTGFNLHKRNNSEAQASHNQQYIGHKRSSEHCIDLPQQYAHYYNRVGGENTNRSPLPSARGVANSGYNSRDNSISLKGKDQLIAFIQNSATPNSQQRKSSKPELQMQLKSKPVEKKPTHHKTNSSDLRSQELSRLQKKNAKDLPAYFKLNLGPSNKKPHSNNTSPIRSSQQQQSHIIPKPKTNATINIDRPKTASSKAPLNPSIYAYQNQDLSRNQNDSRRPSSSRQAQERSTNRDSKGSINPPSASLYTYRPSKEDIYAHDRNTPINVGESSRAKPTLLNFEKRKNSRPTTGESYLNNYLNRYDLHSKRNSKEGVPEKVVHDTRRNSNNYIVPTVPTGGHDQHSSTKFYNNQALQSVFNKVSKYLGKPKTGRVDLLEKNQAAQVSKNLQHQIGSLFPSRKNSVSNYLNSVDREDSARINTRNITDIEFYAPSGSRKSSIGHISKGRNSIVNSKDNSPRESSAKPNRKGPIGINELKEMLKANRKLVELVEPSVKFILNDSLINEEKKIWKQPVNDDKGYEMVEESVKVYKNLKEDTSYSKDPRSDHKTQSASTEEDSKHSTPAINKRPINSLIETSKISRCSINLQNFPVSQGSHPSSRNQFFLKHKINIAIGDFSDQINNRSSHKKGSKSVSITNPVDQMMQGVQLPVNLSKLKKDNLFTPELSENNSLNASLLTEYQALRLRDRDANKEEYSRNGTPTQKNPSHRQPSSPKSTQNPPSNLPPSGAKDRKQIVTPQSSNTKMKAEESDDEYLRDKLMKILYENFKNKGSCPSTSLDYYRLVKMIGKGAFGKVYLGVHLLTGEYVAIKSIEKQYMKDEASKRKIFQEVLILKRCNHRNIIKLLEVFENKKYLFMVQEYASQGDLLTYVKDKGKLTEIEAKGIFKQIVHGVQHCHHLNILHRDIKLDNILLDTNMVVKICDFGVSRFIKKGQLINEQCGTPAYIAPEIIRDKGYEGCYADLWSMGVLLYAIVTGTVPFKANNLDELHYAILDGSYSFPSSLTDDVKDLISKFLRVNPYTRIDIDEVDKHPWFQPNRLMDGRSKSTVASIKSNYEDRYEQKRASIADIEAMINRQRNDKEPSDDTVINEMIVRKVEALGYPREFIISSVQNNSCTHASACYFLILKKLKGN